MTTMIDTNIIIILLNPEHAFHDCVLRAVDERKAEGPLIVSDIVYCEASMAMPSVEAMNETIIRLGLDRIPNSDAVLFRAGRAFKQYREENNGPKLGVLPDFIIGATAEAEGLPLLTTNARDFTGYYPGLEVIEPQREPEAIPGQ
jgi:predicted nucleic acid-binding protein